MEPKRPAYERYAARSSNSFSELIDEDLRSRLASVGPRARKHVSEGHITATHIPSYEGLTTGALNQSQIRERYIQEMSTLPSTSAKGSNVKRMRVDESADDYGDTEDDEPDNSVPMVDNDKKIYHRPNSHRSVSSHTDDFEEADFLRPTR